MPPIEAVGPNADQIKYWNETAGPRWVVHQQFIDTQIRPLGELAMDRAGLRAGEHVVDVGCGCGNTTLELARRVDPNGSATGVDISSVMLERAREAAAAAGVANVRFENADVQTHTFRPNAFSAAFSRFGVMFFVDPVAAFANLRAALVPGGRLAFVCWGVLPENPWMFVPLMAAAQHIALPPPPAPDAPGPFSFANPDRVRDILSRAGFRDIALEQVNETLTIGAGLDLDQIVELMLQMGPTAMAVREAGKDHLDAINRSVREALAPHQKPEGVRLGSAAWIVTARGE